MAAATSAAGLGAAGVFAGYGNGGGVIAIPFVLFGLWIGVAAAYSTRKRWPRVLALPRARRLRWLSVFGALMLPFALATVAVGLSLVIVLFSVRP